MDFRNVMRAGAWVVGGLVIVAAIAVTALVMINWRDEAPSKQSRQLDQLLDAPSAVLDDDNAFVVALGLAAPVGRDPLALGRDRKAFLDAFRPVGRTVSDLPGQDHDYRTRRSKSVADLAGACSGGAASCVRQLESSPGDADEWLESEAWLLDRYRLLITRSAWRESAPTDLRAPMPPYQHMLEGQKLHLLDAWRTARAGDAAGAHMLIDADMRFWRMMLASSDLLISKMIATAGVRRNLTLGSVALREVAADATGDVPMSWAQPLTVHERSLRRALAGEWRFSRRAIPGMADPGAGLDFAAQEQEIDRVFVRVLYKPQATANLFAGTMTRLAETSELPLPQLERGLADLEKEHESHGINLYNPAGRMLISAGGALIYRDYVARVADLETLRATAILAMSVRTQVGRTGASAAVQQARDPSGKPFVWDESNGALSFKPLERRQTEDGFILL